MDHSVKSVVLLQDQLLQIFFENIILNKTQEKENNNEQQNIKKNINPPIQETKREDEISSETNQMEVHNVFDEKQESLKSVLSQKELPSENIQVNNESEEEMEFHDIYEARNSHNISKDAKKNVMINLKETMILGTNPKSLFKNEAKCGIINEEESKDKIKIIKSKFTEVNIPKIKDRLTILTIAYHNFAVELEYLSKYFSKHIKIKN